MLKVIIKMRTVLGGYDRAVRGPLEMWNDYGGREMGLPLVLKEKQEYNNPSHTRSCIIQNMAISSRPLVNLAIN